MSPKVSSLEKSWNWECLAPRKLKDRVVNRDVLAKDCIRSDQFLGKVRHVSPTRMGLTFELSDPAHEERGLQPHEYASGFAPPSAHLASRLHAFATSCHE